MQKKIDALPSYTDRQMIAGAVAVPALTAFSSEDAITQRLLAAAQSIHRMYEKGMIDAYQVLAEIGQPLQQKSFAMWEIVNDLAHRQFYDRATTGMLDEFSARRIAQMYCKAMGVR